MAIKWRLDGYQLKQEFVPVPKEFGPRRVRVKAKTRNGIKYRKTITVWDVPVYRAHPESNTTLFRTEDGKPMRMVSSEKRKEEIRPLYRLCPLIHGKVCDCPFYSDVKKGNSSLCSVQVAYKEGL